jgi:hypothetical protein
MEGRRGANVAVGPPECDAVLRKSQVCAAVCDLGGIKVMVRAGQYAKIRGRFRVGNKMLDLRKRVDARSPHDARRCALTDR